MKGMGDVTHILTPLSLVIMGKEPLQWKALLGKVEEIVDIVAHNQQVVLSGQLYYLLATLLGGEGKRVYSEGGKELRWATCIRKAKGHGEEHRFTTGELYNAVIVIMNEHEQAIHVHQKIKQNYTIYLEAGMCQLGCGR